jgi:metal-responsive CopG/Arc/MetJ family transcriptional regulator
MRVKVSITLTEELLKAIDQCAERQRMNRSDFIEAVRPFIGRLTRNEQNARDLEIINNRHADVLNQEANDMLEY